jgi:hypothetical protein
MMKNIRKGGVIGFYNELQTLYNSVKFEDVNKETQIDNINYFLKTYLKDIKLYIEKISIDIDILNKILYIILYLIKNTSSIDIDILNKILYIILYLILYRPNPIDRNYLDDNIYSILRELIKKDMYNVLPIIKDFLEKQIKIILNSNIIFHINIYDLFNFVKNILRKLIKENKISIDDLLIPFPTYYMNEDLIAFHLLNDVNVSPENIDKIINYYLQEKTDIYKDELINEINRLNYNKDYEYAENIIEILNQTGGKLNKSHLVYKSKDGRQVRKKIYIINGKPKVRDGKKNNKINYISLSTYKKKYP